MQTSETGGADRTPKPAFLIQSRTCLSLDRRKVDDLGLADEPRKDNGQWPLETVGSTTEWVVWKVKEVIAYSRDDRLLGNGAAPWLLAYAQGHREP